MSGQIASLYADIRANVDDAINNVKKFTNSLSNAESAAEKFSQQMSRAGLASGQSFDDFQKQTQKSSSSTINWLDKLGKKILTVASIYKGGKFILDSMQAFVEYGDEVRNVARITGATAEESSRLIQVADQVGITTNTLTSAMQLAIKKGYEPTIEGLMRMSDEYTSIIDPMERVLYLQQRFTQGGRGGGGAGMAPLLELGSAGISSLAEGVPGGLVLSNQDLYQARLTAFTLNALGDAGKSLTTGVGSVAGQFLFKGFAKNETQIKGITDYAKALKTAGVSQEDFNEQIEQFANTMTRFEVGKTGDLIERLPGFRSRTIMEDFFGATWAIDNTAASYQFLSDVQKKQLEEQEKTRSELRATTSSMLLSNAITDDGVSINEDYTRTMADIAAREAELNDILDDPSWKHKTNDIKAAREELEQLKQTEIEITAKYRQQTSVGLFNLFAGGMEGATDKDLLDIAHNMGILDDKTYGLQAAAFDLQDGLDGSADGLITMNDIARKNIGSFGDLNKVFTDLSENAPQGGSADYYYNLFITTYYRTVGSSGGGITAQVQTGGLGHQTRELKNQARHGGSFIGMQHGGIVPPGFSNDGMPVFVSSGERLDVTPAGNKDVTNTALLSKLDDLNYKLDGLPRAMKEAVLQVV